jgi:hypothetical protein
VYYKTLTHYRKKLCETSAEETPAEVVYKRFHDVAIVSKTFPELHKKSIFNVPCVESEFSFLVGKTPFMSWCSIPATVASKSNSAMRGVFDKWPHCLKALRFGSKRGVGNVGAWGKPKWVSALKRFFSFAW